MLKYCWVIKVRSGKIKKNLLLTAIITASLAGVPVQAYMTPEANILYQQACTLEYQRNYKEAIEKVKEAINLAGEDALLYIKLAGL